jgi:hypothetical protein
MSPLENSLPCLRTGLLQSVMVISCLISLILWSKIQYFKHQNRIVSILPKNNSSWAKDTYLKDSYRIFLTILMFVVSVFFQWYINNVAVPNLNSYPGHLIEHLFRYYWVNVMASFSVFIHFKNPVRILSFWKITS